MRCSTSGRLTPAAATLTRISWGFGSGRARSAGRRTSGPPGLLDLDGAHGGAHLNAARAGPVAPAIDAPLNASAEPDYDAALHAAPSRLPGCMLILASAALARESAPLPGADGRVSLGAYVEVLEDPAGRLRLEDVRRPEHAARFAAGGLGPGQFRLHALGLVAALQPARRRARRRGAAARGRVPEHRPHRAAPSRAGGRRAGRATGRGSRATVPVGRARNEAPQLRVPLRRAAAARPARLLPAGAIAERAHHAAHAVAAGGLRRARPRRAAAARRCSTALRSRWCCTT